MTDRTCWNCGASNLDVSLEYEAHGNCPRCHIALVENLRLCCVPKCDNALPTSRRIPVCDSCGVKIALAHLNEASTYDVVMAEARRREEAAAEERRNGKPGVSVVYYVRLGPARIKIGFTSRLRERVSALRVHPTALLAIEPGGRSVEAERHAQFAADRIDPRREDFRPSSDLLGWIEALAANNARPGWATLPDTRVEVRSA